MRCALLASMVLAAGFATGMAPRTAPAPAPSSGRTPSVAAQPAAGDAAALDHTRRAQQMIDKAIAYLRTKQDAASGGWNVSADGPSFPAITALVLTGMLMDSTVDQNDPAVQRAIDYMLSKQQPDGSISDRLLPSYNTSICLSALGRIDRPDIASRIKAAQDYLRSLQWSENAAVTEGENGVVEKDHPFYGGVGYGRHGRPDGSNVGMFIQGLHDSGLDCNDPAIQRAIVFLQRTQMLDEVNDMPYADGSSQGGFIYATSVDKDQVGVGQSQAAPDHIEETLDDGTRVSRLRAYGSMTYSGFKSYLYAELKRDDVRVTAAYDWIRRNYTLEENPGAGTDGLYYYYLTFARAMDAWGEEKITPIGTDGRELPARNWAADLVDRLETLQNDDGSFKSVDDRWMENDPVLITAYALIALRHAAQ